MKTRWKTLVVTVTLGSFALLGFKSNQYAQGHGYEQSEISQLAALIDNKGATQTNEQAALILEVWSGHEPRSLNESMPGEWDNGR